MQPSTGSTVSMAVCKDQAHTVKVKTGYLLHLFSLVHEFNSLFTAHVPIAALRSLKQWVKHIHKADPFLYNLCSMLSEDSEIRSLCPLERPPV